MSLKDQSSWMKYYNEMIVLLDTLANSKRDISEEEIDRLDFLAEHGNFTVKDVAELNACNECKTWKQLVKELRVIHRK